MNEIEQQIKFWKQSAKESLKTADDLFKTKHYDACLFFCHLAIEKIVKAKIVKEEKEIPYIHNLIRLVSHAGLKIDDTTKQNLLEITAFNVEARYDDIKRSFYKKATKNYTLLWLDKCKDIFNDFEKQL